MAKRRQKEQNSSPKRKVQKTSTEQQSQAYHDVHVLPNGDGLATPDLVNEPALKHSQRAEDAAVQDAADIDASAQQQQSALVQGQSDDLVALHRIRFVPWKPTAGIGTATTSDGSLLAVLRQNRAIEVWDTEAWVCLLVGS